MGGRVFLDSRSATRGASNSPDAASWVPGALRWLALAAALALHAHVSSGAPARAPPPPLRAASPAPAATAAAAPLASLIGGAGASVAQAPLHFRGIDASWLAPLDRALIAPPGRGGRRISLDWGARNGDSLQELFDWERGLHELLAGGTDDGSPIFTEAHCFEARSEYNAVWEGIAARARARGVRVHFHNFAVWTENTTLSFTLADVASSAMQVAHEAFKDSQREQVAAVDIAAWLAANVREEDHVMVKCDIELAEVPVFRHLRERLAVRFLDVILYECHFFRLTGLDPALTEKECSEECSGLVAQFSHLRKPPEFFFWARKFQGAQQEGFWMHRFFRTPANDCDTVFDTGRVRDIDHD